MSNKIVAGLALSAPASGATALFDFNGGPQFTSVPLDLTVDGITAHFAATGQGFSIQNTQQVILTLPLEMVFWSCWKG